MPPFPDSGVDLSEPEKPTQYPSLFKALASLCQFFSTRTVRSRNTFVSKSPLQFLSRVRANGLDLVAPPADQNALLRLAFHVNSCVNDQNRPVLGLLHTFNGHRRSVRQLLARMVIDLFTDDLRNQKGFGLIRFHLWREKRGPGSQMLPQFGKERRDAFSMQGRHGHDGIEDVEVAECPP